MAKATLIPKYGDGVMDVIGGQTAVYVPSPLPMHPGGVWVPVEMSPAQFDAWYRLVMADQKANERLTADGLSEPEHPILAAWPTRYQMILKWDIEGVTPDMVTENPLTMPSMTLISWVMSITNEIILRATSFPNSPAPLTGGANGNGKD